MKIRNKIATLCLTFAMIVGILLAGSASTVSAASDPANAPVDWAFDASSVELNDAIIAEYPTIDSDGDGYVSINEAENWSGAAILLTGKNISGTMNGIEHFINVEQLSLEDNSLQGSIPQNFGNMVKLKYFTLAKNQLTGELPTSLGNLKFVTNAYLYANQLTGSIPNNIGDFSPTTLSGLYLQNNQLTGAVPASIGNMTNLKELSLRSNKLSGLIPSEIGNMASLEKLYLYDNDFEGKLPESIYNMSSLNMMQVQDNPKLTGNPSIGLASNTTLNYLDIRGTSLIQASPEIPTLGYTVGSFLYDELASDLLTSDKSNLNGPITQNDIDNAQESANFITDPTIKQQWQDDIDLAQKMLNAKNKVDDLLTTPDFANLKPGVDADIINDAQDAVNKLPAGSLKDELQDKIDIAKNLLDAKKKTEALVNPDGSLAIGVDQGKIDDAQTAVNKLPNGETKTELQKIIDEAQKQLNQKSVVSKPSTKPSISGGDTVGGREVNTGDATNLIALYAMLGMAILGLAVTIRKKQEDK